MSIAMKLFNNLIWPHAITMALLLFTKHVCATSIKPIPLNSFQLLELSTDVIEGTIVDFAYRSVVSSSPDYGSEYPVGADRFKRNLEARVRVEKVLFRRYDHLPPIDRGQIIFLWLNIDSTEWLPQLGKQNLYFLKYNGLHKDNWRIHGYNTKQWPSQIFERSVIENLPQKIN